MREGLSFIGSLRNVGLRSICFSSCYGLGYLLFVGLGCPLFKREGASAEAAAVDSSYGIL